MDAHALSCCHPNPKPLLRRTPLDHQAAVLACGRAADMTGAAPLPA